MVFEVLIIGLLLAVLGGIGFIIGRRRGRKPAVVFGLVGFGISIVSIVLLYATQTALHPIIQILLCVISLGAGIASLALALSKPQTQPIASSPGFPADSNAAYRTNSLALASIIVVWFSSVVGLILGHVALSQINRTGESGRGMALTSVIVGWIATSIAVIFAIIYGVQLARLVSS